jgi:predicted nucleotidyltransferase
MNSSEKGVNEKGFNEMMLTGDIVRINGFHKDRYSQFIEYLDEYKKNGNPDIINEDFIEKFKNIPFEFDVFTNKKKKTLEM